ncbi:MAG: chaperone modulator CbpM [Methylophilus sp.]|nr:chaperone modulator CbpM [Methylophilus sp.]
MTENNIQIEQVSIVENEVQMTAVELCHSIGLEHEYLIAWVYEGILSPTGNSPEDWQFGGDSLSRAKKALRLSRCLEINTPGVAMVMDLLDEISLLRKQIA